MLQCYVLLLSHIIRYCRVITVFVLVNLVTSLRSRLELSIPLQVTRSTAFAVVYFGWMGNFLRQDPSGWPYVRPMCLLGNLLQKILYGTNWERIHKVIEWGNLLFFLFMTHKVVIA